MRQIYRARAALEGVTAADFARSASAEQRARLEQLQQELELCVEERAPERFGRLNAEWHQLLVEGSGSTIVGELLQRLNVPIHRLLFDSFYDAERLRILLERHHLYTGSARARALLEDWDAALPRFVKVMPRDYRRALLELQAEQRASKTAAAE